MLPILSWWVSYPLKISRLLCSSCHPTPTWKFFDLPGPKTKNPLSSIFGAEITKNLSIFHLLDQKKEERPPFFFFRLPLSTNDHQLLSAILRSGSSGRSSTLKIGPEIEIGLLLSWGVDLQTDFPAQRSVRILRWALYFIFEEIFVADSIVESHHELDVLEHTLHEKGLH